VVRGQKLPTACVHAKFEDRSFTRLRNIEGVPKFRNWGTCPRRRPISGQFVVRGQELPTAYVHAKFEDRSFFRLRNIGTFRCAALIDPVTLTFDLEVGVGVACDLGYPCAKFRLPRPFGFRVRADVRDIRQTDRRTTDADDRLMPPPTGRGHNNTRSSAVAERPRNASCLSVVSFNIQRSFFITTYCGCRFTSA